MNDRILPWLKFTHASPETFEEYDRLKKAEAELAEAKSIIERLRNRDVLYQKLMKAEAEVRQLTELYDDLAYVCPPEKAKAHIMRLEAELAECRKDAETLHTMQRRVVGLEAELADCRERYQCLNANYVAMRAERNRLKAELARINIGGCDTHFDFSSDDPWCPVCLIQERDRLRGYVRGLLAFVEGKHPEIGERGQFACPHMQTLAQEIRYFKVKGGE